MEEHEKGGTRGHVDTWHLGEKTNVQWPLVGTSDRKWPLLEVVNTIGTGALD